jgi:hypothetical protein
MLNLYLQARAEPVHSAGTAHTDRDTHRGYRDARARPERTREGTSIRFPWNHRHIAKRAFVHGILFIRPWFIYNTDYNLIKSNKNLVVPSTVALRAPWRALAPHRTRPSRRRASPGGGAPPRAAPGRAYRELLTTITLKFVTYQVISNFEADITRLGRRAHARALDRAPSRRRRLCSVVLVAGSRPK